ncbi:MAG: MlaD family protein [Chitinophagaceae bacterium]
MKISNETKVGALTAIAITLLILGFNFLKGKSVFKTGFFVTAQFENTQGIMISNAVYINGFQVGSVYDIESVDANLSKLLVTIKLKSAFQIPINSIAEIKASALGASSMVISLGDSKQYLPSGGELKTKESKGLMASISEKLDPLSAQLSTTLNSLNAVLQNLQQTLDANAKNNLQKTLENLAATSQNLNATTASLNKMLDPQNGSLTASVKNVQSITKNLADNNQRITQTLQNVEQTTNQLAKANIDKTVENLNHTVKELNEVLQKIDSKEGSLGLLINDKTLYNNLNNTLRSSNILLDDLRLHPKRYVNISVFGKKDKKGPLMAPITDSVVVKP